MKRFVMMTLVLSCVVLGGCQKNDTSLMAGPELWGAACEHLTSTKLEGVRDMAFTTEKAQCFALLRDGLPEQTANKVAACFLRVTNAGLLSECLVDVYF
jgi:hypothetical protein